MKVLRISAKCSDLFFADLQGEKEYSGYVPAWLPNKNVNHYGDYVELVIDIDTGMILNWEKPTKTQLEETFG
jgi:hypothetical protein